jgi:hypothetical protein
MLLINSHFQEYFTYGYSFVVIYCLLSDNDLLADLYCVTLLCKLTV